MFRLASYERNEFVSHKNGRHEELLIIGVGHRTGERVEDGGHVVTDFRIAGQQPDVFVNAGRSRVIVARPNVDIAFDRPSFFSDDECELDMGFQTFDTVGNVQNFFFCARPDTDPEGYYGVFFGDNRGIKDISLAPINGIIPMRIEEVN